MLCFSLGYSILVPFRSLRHFAQLFFLFFDRMYLFAFAWMWERTRKKRKKNIYFSHNFDSLVRVVEGLYSLDEYKWPCSGAYFFNQCVYVCSKFQSFQREWACVWCACIGFDISLYNETQNISLVLSLTVSGCTMDI